MNIFTPVLKVPHWLPIQYRIQCKILVITYKALKGQSPLYIRNLLQVCKPTRNLQSQNNATALVLPKNCKVMFGDRSVATAAPKLWNSLPEGIRHSGSLAIFKNQWKHTFHTNLQTINCWFVLLPCYFNQADSYTYFTVMPSYISCLSYSYNIVVVLH